MFDIPYEDHYTVLGLRHDCDQFDIGIAYKNLPPDLSERDRILTRHAYNTLNDMDSRRRYDQTVLWKDRFAFFTLAKDKRRQAFDSETERLRAQPGGEDPGRKDIRARCFADMEKKADVAFHRERLNHMWTLAGSDADRLRLLGILDAMIQRATKRVERAYDDHHKSVKVHPIDWTFFDAQLRIMKLMAESVADANSESYTSRQAMKTLGRGTDDCRRVVLGERSQRKAQVWKPSQELAAAFTLDKQWKKMSKQLTSVLFHESTYKLCANITQIISVWDAESREAEMTRHRLLYFDELGDDVV